MAAVLVAPLEAFRTAYAAFHPPRAERCRKPGQFGLVAREFTVYGADGVRLAAWLCRGADRGRVVVLGHGLGLEKSRSLPYARFLHRAGYTVVLFDFRNHGGSSHDASFGGYDGRFADDAVAVVRQVRALPDFAGARLALYGFSLSSFAMLRALERLHGTVDAVVCDSGPACDPPAISVNLLRQGLLPLPEAMRRGAAKAVVERVFKLLNRRTMGAGAPWPPPPSAAGYATTPLLFIGGGADAVVPAEEVLRLARRYPRAETLVVPGARHLRALWADKERYTRTVLEFLERCLAPDTPGADTTTGETTRAVR